MSAEKACSEGLLCPGASATRPIAEDIHSVTQLTYLNTLWARQGAGMKEHVPVGQEYPKQVTNKKEKIPDQGEDHEGTKVG